VAKRTQSGGHNPCELQIDLFCRGMEIDPSCSLARDARGIVRERAGLGSGLEIVIEGSPRDVWANVPVLEPFVAGSPFLLGHTDRYEVLDRRDGATYPVRIPEEPSWYERRTSSGTLMRKIGTLQGTYLAIYLGNSCEYWRMDPSLQCGFCTTGLNVDTAVRKTVQDVVETARAAKEESGVTFVHFNTGYQGGGALRLVTPFARAIKEGVGALVGVQVVPEAPLAEFDRLIRLGVDHFSFCFEYFDPDVFARRCPGKDQTVGQLAFFRALEHCQARMPKGSCSGEIIAGSDADAQTRAAIDYITSLGAFPTVCVFRPLQGSGLADAPPPSFAEMRAVMKYMWERCRDRGIPIGVAPNVQVSLIVQPLDAAYLADDTWRDRWYLAKLGLLRKAARRRFRRATTARKAAHYGALAHTDRTGVGRHEVCEDEPQPPAQDGWAGRDRCRM